ncbi:MAG TPA: J domain-containing protein [Chryseosolibacter sp.]|nr:J domain-containing protein [Chryseosolibacter sp.]
MKDYYGILGVSPSASHSEIKRAFRKLAVRYHPDKNPSTEAKSLFQEINEANDVLADREKRALYDARLANPFAELLNEPAPGHRDPAYRRTQPGQRTGRKGPSPSFILMRDYLPYMMWVSRIGLLFTVLFFLDYLLPYRQVNDVINAIYEVPVSRGQVNYTVITGSGKKLRLYDERAADLTTGETVLTSVTMIFGSVITLSSPGGSYSEWVAYMYSTLIFFPILLFVISSLAFIYRRHVEFCFNLNVAGVILLVINIVLI